LPDIARHPKPDIAAQALWKAPSLRAPSTDALSCYDPKLCAMEGAGARLPLTPSHSTNVTLPSVRVRYLWGVGLEVSPYHCAVSYHLVRNFESFKFWLTLIISLQGCTGLSRPDRIRREKKNSAKRGGLLDRSPRNSFRRRPSRNHQCRSFGGKRKLGKSKKKKNKKEDLAAHFRQQ
jgi:hypothetical protein